MYRWFRLLSLLMALVIAGTFLAACDDEEEEPVAEDVPAVEETEEEGDVDVGAEEETEVVTIETPAETEEAETPEVDATPAEAADETPEADATPADEDETPEAAGTPGAEGAIPGPGVTITEILAAPETYIGRTVSVNGSVVEVINENAFTISGEEEGGENALLVVGAAEAFAEGLELETDQFVQVRGMLRDFVLTEIEEDLGVDFDDEAFEEFEDQPVLVAQEVLPAASIDEILDTPDEFIGQTVTVSGQVAEVISPEAFTVAGAEEDPETLLVVGTQDVVPGTLTPGVFVQALGTVVDFELATVEEELGIDLDDELFADFEGQPALVAERVERAATVAEILEDPTVFLEHRARITGSVGQVFDEQAFTVQAEEGEGELFVVGPPAALPEDVAEGDFVDVAGMIQEFNETELENEFGIDIPDDAAAEFEGQPVLVAEADEE